MTLGRFDFGGAPSSVAYLGSLTSKNQKEPGNPTSLHIELNKRKSPIFGLFLHAEGEILIRRSNHGVGEFLLVSGNSTPGAQTHTALLLATSPRAHRESSL